MNSMIKSQKQKISKNVLKLLKESRLERLEKLFNKKFG